MPLKRCNQDGVLGWKFGDQGHCYTGKNSKKQAINQGIKIYGPKKFSQIMKSSGEEETIKEMIADPKVDTELTFALMDSLGYNILEQSVALATKMGGKQK